MEEKLENMNRVMNKISVQIYLSYRIFVNGIISIEVDTQLI